MLFTISAELVQSAKSVSAPILKESWGSLEFSIFAKSDAFITSDMIICFPSSTIIRPFEGSFPSLVSVGFNRSMSGINLLSSVAVSILTVPPLSIHSLIFSGTAV